MEKNPSAIKNIVIKLPTGRMTVKGLAKSTDQRRDRKLKGDEG
jgi:hypothetical protein